MGILAIQPWELNHVQHQLTYVTIGALTTMMDVGKQPKR